MKEIFLDTTYVMLFFYMDIYGELLHPYGRFPLH